MTKAVLSDLGASSGAVQAAPPVGRIPLLYRASDTLMNALVWLDTNAPDWVRAEVKQTRSELYAAIERERSV